MNTPVRTLLRRKGPSVITTTPEATVLTAIQTMVDHNVGSVVVVVDGAPIGIFTERDYLRRIVLRGRTSDTTRVREVMTSDLVTAAPDTTVEECLSLMTQVRCRHLPVLADGRLAGLVSIGDCVTHLLRAAESQVVSLQNYVLGRYPA